MAISSPWPIWSHPVKLAPKQQFIRLDQDTGEPLPPSEDDEETLDDASFQANPTAVEKRHPGANNLLEGEARLYTTKVLREGDRIKVHFDDEGAEIREYRVKSNPSRHYGVIASFSGQSPRRGYSLKKVIP